MGDLKTMQAKFAVAQVQQELDPTGKVAAINLQLYPVTDSSEANKAWSQWTPSGNLTMRITNEALFSAFRPGQEFYLDFTLAR